MQPKDLDAGRMGGRTTTEPDLLECDLEQIKKKKKKEGKGKYQCEDKMLRALAEPTIPNATCLLG